MGKKLCRAIAKMFSFFPSSLFGLGVTQAVNGLPIVSSTANGGSVAAAANGCAGGSNGSANGGANGGSVNGSSGATLNGGGGGGAGTPSPVGSSGSNGAAAAVQAAAAAAAAAGNPYASLTEPMAAVFAAGLHPAVAAAAAAGYPAARKQNFLTSFPSYVFVNVIT